MKHFHKSMDQFMAKTISPIPSGAVASGGQPYVRIVEQPAKCALRFRYECEGRSAGAIPGLLATSDNKTYPSIQVCNYKGSAVVVVSCVTKDQPYRPHPHNLVGKEGCKKGVCTQVINNQDMICTFTSLGIQCVKRKDIEDSLKLRESIKVDPYRTGFGHRSQSSSIDLNVVRLCFQVFIEGPERDKFTVQLPPIVTEAIYDKKAMTELIITKLSHCSAPCSGGQEMILLCDRVAKDDIQVRFVHEINGQIQWEGFADFGPGDVHKQVAICLRTPRYKNDNLTQPVSVQLQLLRPSDGCLSDPRLFQMMPIEADPDGLTRKRQKISDPILQRFFKENFSTQSQSSGDGMGQAVGVTNRDIIHVPRMTTNSKFEPIGAINTQSLMSSVTPTSQTSWMPTNSQLMPLAQPQQQLRPQIDVLLSQDYRSSQLSSQMSTQSMSASQSSTQSDMILSNIPNDNAPMQSSQTLGVRAILDLGLCVTSNGIIFDNNNVETNNNINTNTRDINQNQLNANTSDVSADEVVDKMDSLGLDIDTSDLLSLTPSLLSALGMSSEFNLYSNNSN